MLHHIPGCHDIESLVVCLCITDHGIDITGNEIIDGYAKFIADDLCITGPLREIVIEIYLFEPDLASQQKQRTQPGAIINETNVPDVPVCQFNRPVNDIGAALYGKEEPVAGMVTAEIMFSES